MIPKMWLEGQQITGKASDTSPVLANCEIDWGASSDVEHQSAATMSFQIMFRGGSMDLADFRRGAEVELTYDTETVFAGKLGSASAVPTPHGLLVTASCVEHLADLETLFTATDWLFETSSVRWQTLRDLFVSKGYELLPRALSHGHQEGQAFYNSIKVLTLLERWLASNGKLTRWDASQRVEGVLQKRVKAGYRGESSAANTLDTEGKIWVVDYSADTNTGVITWLDGDNVIQSAWNLEPGTVINSVGFQYPVTETDAETGEKSTSLREGARNDTASIATYGVNSAEVTISAHGENIAQTLDEVAPTWYRQDQGWTLEEAQIYDADNVTHERILRLLDNERRTQNLVIIRGVLGQQPNDTASNIRASLIGGNYVWSGDKWEITLRLGRNQDFSAGNQWTFADIAAAADPEIRNGTAASIGEQITYADFKQISKD